MLRWVNTRGETEPWSDLQRDGGGVRRRRERLSKAEFKSPQYRPSNPSNFGISVAVFERATVR